MIWFALPILIVLALLAKPKPTVVPSAYETRLRANRERKAAVTQLSDHPQFRRYRRPY